MTYSSWAQCFRGSSIEFIGVQLPGRETRVREQPTAQLSSLLESLLPAIAPLLDQSFLFLGHSLGALIAFELCRLLRRHGLPLPQQLFVSAFRSPELANPNRELHRLSDAEMIDSLREYGGTTEEVLANEELLKLFLPLLRADFSLDETYRYQQEIPLACPITAFAGTEDEIVKPLHMLNWQQQTDAKFQKIKYPGDHFFLYQDQHRDNITQRVKQAFAVDQPVLG